MHRAALGGTGGVKTIGNYCHAPVQRTVSPGVREIEWTPKKQSNANKSNRSKRPNEHHAGSCPFIYIVEECAEAGSKFLEIDAFEITYGGKSKNITNDTAKAKFNEMVVKKDEYIKVLAKDFPEDTPLENIIVTAKMLDLIS